MRLVSVERPKWPLIVKSKPIVYSWIDQHERSLFGDICNHNLWDK